MKPFPRVTAAQTRAAAESQQGVTITGAQARSIGQLTVWGPSRSLLVAPIPGDPDGAVWASFCENGPAHSSTYVIGPDGHIGHHSQAAWDTYEKFTSRHTSRQGSLTIY